ncbi:MAG: hypothetical protein R3F53_26585 [Gammaproteobacteria bacterium]
MSKSSYTSYSLAQIVSIGLANGASSDQITRIAIQHFKAANWTTAEQYRFRQQIAELIAKQRHRK